jgi:hypothetical protein
VPKLTPFRTSEPCRIVRLAPYLKGKGPTFTLRIWDDLPSNDPYGKFRVAYELRQHDGSEYVVQQHTGSYGWEDVTSEETRMAAQDQLLAYRQNMPMYPARIVERRHVSVLFTGDDIHLSAGTCTDSDRAVAEVLGWLTLRPGDTDSDFFRDYTPEQHAFAESHAETLNMEAVNRFGEY